MWAAPDLTYFRSIITEDAVGYWPGGRVVRGSEQYMQFNHHDRSRDPVQLRLVDSTTTIGGLVILTYQRA